MTALTSPLVPVFDTSVDDVEAPEVLVAIPAYNEERFIGSVVHGVRMQGYPCLVIDDGSSDRTVQIALAAGAIVERHIHNRGKGAAMNSAFRFARRVGARILVAMDGDWQHDPQEIGSLVAPIRAGEAHIVSGSRFLTPARRGVPVVRGLGLRAVTLASNVASGQWLTDSQTGFRAFSREAFEKLHFRSGGFSVESEVQLLARIRGLRHLEVAISTRYEDPPKRNVFGQGASVVDGLIRLVAHYRPLLFFGLPSLIMLCLGIALGGLVVHIYDVAGQLAGGYALLAVLLVILGSIGLFTGILLHVLRGIFLGLETGIHALAQVVEGGNRPR